MSYPRVPRTPMNRIREFLGGGYDPLPRYRVVDLETGKVISALNDFFATEDMIVGLLAQGRDWQNLEVVMADGSPTFHGEDPSFWTLKIARSDPEAIVVAEAAGLGLLFSCPAAMVGCTWVHLLSLAGELNPQASALSEDLFLPSVSLRPSVGLQNRGDLPRGFTSDGLWVAENFKRDGWEPAIAEVLTGVREHLTLDGKTLDILHLVPEPLWHEARDRLRLVGLASSLAECQGRRRELEGWLRSRGQEDAADQLEWDIDQE